MGSYTEIVNRTSKALKLQVGNNRVYREIAIVEKDGVYKISVDPNATYHEFCMGVDAAGKSVIVDSDECVDNKCITITESVDGKFDVVKVPRQHVQQPQVDQVAPTTFRSAGTTVSPAASTHATRRQSTSWTFWKAQKKSFEQSSKSHRVCPTLEGPLV